MASTDTFCAQLGMAGAVSVLEALFVKAQSDLSYVSCRLEQEFAEEYTAAGCSKLNPLRLIQRLTEIQAQVQALSTRAEKIENDKQALAVELHTALTRNNKQLAQLQAAADISATHDFSADMAVVEACANGADAVPVTAATQEAETAEAAADENANPTAQPIKAASNVDPNFRKSYDPITEEEFNSISELVRGRVKLDDVNQVYQAIFEHFMKKKAQPLTIRDMTNMGLRITGQTGECKLKVLRHMKIINIGKEGVTLAY